MWGNGARQVKLNQTEIVSKSIKVDRGVEAAAGSQFLKKIRLNATEQRQEKQRGEDQKPMVKVLFGSAAFQKLRHKVLLA